MQRPVGIPARVFRHPARLRVLAGPPKEKNTGKAPPHQSRTVIKNAGMNKTAAGAGGAVMMTGRDCAARFGPHQQPRAGRGTDRPLLILGLDPTARLPGEKGPRLPHLSITSQQAVTLHGACLNLALLRFSDLEENVSFVQPAGLFDVRRALQGSRAPRASNSSQRLLQARIQPPTLVTPPVARSTPPKRPTTLPAKLKGKASSPCVHPRTCLAASHAIPSAIALAAPSR